MKGTSRSAGSLLRKIVAALILVPLGIALIAFAVANRQPTAVSFDPFNPAQPAYSKTMWLFVPIFTALIFGVAIGGLASWLRHGRWRRTARRLERELAKLRDELESHKRAARSPAGVPQAAEPPERLKLKPPVN